MQSMDTRSLIKALSNQYTNAPFSLPKGEQF